MNRTDALHILGLEDDATADDIKIAYRETVQILHPDKFAGNEKLQNRATEQFKRLQEAYDLLTSGSGGGRSARAGRSSRSGASSGPATSSGAARAWTEVEDGVEVEYLTEAEIKARLAGIAAARAQLVAQRDAGRAVLLVSLELDEVMDVPDRILVMYEGEIVGELDPKTTTQEELGLYMAGAKRDEVKA